MRRFPLHPRLARVMIDAQGSDGAAETVTRLSEGVADPRHVQELRDIARRILGSQYRREVSDETLRRAFLAGYPDRVAMRREPLSPRLLLASGTGATLEPEADPGGDFLVILEILGDTVMMARRIERDWLKPTHRDARIWYYAIPLSEARRTLVSPQNAEIDETLRLRAQFAGLPPERSKRLDQLAPEAIPLPSGRSARLEYREDGSVLASVKLQELFGLAETPRIGPRNTPITFALLAPNGRPVQTTQDLRSFWNNTYPEVRKELRGRYPKHPWPEDPWSAVATHRTRR